MTIDIPLDALRTMIHQLQQEEYDLEYQIKFSTECYQREQKHWQGKLEDKKKNLSLLWAVMEQQYPGKCL